MARKSRLDLDAVRAYIDASEYFTVEDIVHMTGVSRGYAGRMVKKYFAYAILKFKRLPVPADGEDLVIEEKEITGTVLAARRELIKGPGRASLLHFVVIETGEGVIDILTPGGRPLTPLEGFVSLKVLCVAHNGVTRYKLLEVLG